MPKNRLLGLPDIAASIVVAALLLVGLNVPNILRAISSDNQEVTTAYQESIDNIIDKTLTELSDRFLTPDIATFLLWAVLGVISYIAVSAIINSSKDLQETVEMTKNYIRPRYFGKKAFFKHYLVHTGSGLAGILSIFGWIYLCLRYFTGYAMSSSTIALFDSVSLVQRVGYISGAIVSITLGIVGTVVLTRLIKLLGQLAKQRA